jgi:outer membrane protein insertion porin family
VFEISEGDKSKVRAINIIGNEQFDDGAAQGDVHPQAAACSASSSPTTATIPTALPPTSRSCAPFYLTQGYADFRVVSALAELTPDRRDFVITYVVEEGPRYKFGDIRPPSELRDFSPRRSSALVGIKKGDWFNAKAVEDAVTRLNEAAGLLGYAFTEIDPNYERNAEKRVMNITFRVGETPRTYVERIDVSGNTGTRDKVIRREFRVNEGDAFNAIKVKRSQDRIQSLGFFQEKLEIKQEQVAPDRVALNVDVEEKPTGQLQLSGGYSSLERFILQLSVAEQLPRHGPELNAGHQLFALFQVGAAGLHRALSVRQADPARRRGLPARLQQLQLHRQRAQHDLQPGSDRRRPLARLPGQRVHQLRHPLHAELRQDHARQAPSTPTRRTGPGRWSATRSRPASICATNRQADHLAGRLQPGVRQHQRHPRDPRPAAVFSQDFAGLGGDVRYLRSRAEGTKFWGHRPRLRPLGPGRGRLHPSAAGGEAPGLDPIRISDRFFTPQLRGFDIRGIGPRIRRTSYTADATALEDEGQVTDALGGRAYYMGRLELEIPLGAGARNLGLGRRRSSTSARCSSCARRRCQHPGRSAATCRRHRTDRSARRSSRRADQANCAAAPTNTALLELLARLREEFLGNSAKPRLSIGIGVNWTSPFGPLRIDLAKALLKQEGDDPSSSNST